MKVREQEGGLPITVTDDDAVTVTDEKKSCSALKAQSLSLRKIPKAIGIESDLPEE